jgi:hypothetical protein
MSVHQALLAVLSERGSRPAACDDACPPATPSSSVADIHQLVYKIIIAL